MFLNYFLLFYVFSVVGCHFGLKVVYDLIYKSIRCVCLRNWSSVMWIVTFVIVASQFWDQSENLWSVLNNGMDELPLFPFHLCITRKYQSFHRPYYKSKVNGEIVWPSSLPSNIDLPLRNFSNQCKLPFCFWPLDRNWNYVVFSVTRKHTFCCQC